MPSTARSRGSRARLGAVAAVAALAVTGCATPSGGTAFQVEGHSISITELQSAAQACAAPLGFNEGAMDVQIRIIALQGLIGRVLAEQNDLTYTDSQVRDALAAQQVGGALDAAGCSQVARDYGTFFLAATQVGADRGIAQITDMDVLVNPRLGSWDREQLGLRHSNGSLSQVGPDSLDSQG